MLHPKNVSIDLCYHTHRTVSAFTLLSRLRNSAGILEAMQKYT